MAFIALISFFITIFVGKAFWGAAPFSNKYDQFMSVLRVSEQLWAWYVKGLLYSSASFAGVVLVKRKHKPIKQD